MNKFLSTILLFCLIPVTLTAQDQADMMPASEDSLLSIPGFAASKETESADRGRPTRYLIRAGMDFLSGSGESSDSNSNSARFYMTHSHRFTPVFSMGVGIGYTVYNDPFSMVPFFIDLNYRFTDENTTPFINLKAGYNFAIKPDDDLQIDSYTGGLLFNPAAGVEFNTNRGLGIYISAGYNVDKSSYQYETWGNRTVNNYLSFRRLSLGAGFVF